MKNTCYQCQDRESGCHANCEKYLEAKKETDAKRKARLEDRNNEARIWQIMRGGHRK